MKHPTPSPAGEPPAAPSASGAAAVLLVNTGTPQAPRSAAVRRFLRHFLSDRRVIELPRALWGTLVYSELLQRRARRSAV